MKQRVASLTLVAALLTLGQSYDEASKFMHGACSESWIVRASDIREAVP